MGSSPTAAQKSKTMKPLDIVRTPKGGIAFVKETNDGGEVASIRFIGDLNVGDEHNAWWPKSQLTVIDSIPGMLARACAHPFGKGKEDVELFFDTKNVQP